LVKKLVEGFGQTVVDNNNVLTVEATERHIHGEYLPVSTDTVDVFQIPIDTSVFKNVSGAQRTRRYTFFR
jgi:hypothetical protein